MNTNTGNLLATARLGAPVDTGPIDELRVIWGWDPLPTRIWIDDYLSLTPTLNVPIPRDSERRQAVIKAIEVLTSSTQTGVGVIDDLISILSAIAGVTVDPIVGLVLTTVSVGTRAVDRIKIRAIVERVKIVGILCETCDEFYDFGVWSQDELAEKTQTCDHCGADVDSDRVFVL